MWTERENDLLIAVLDELIPANKKVGVPAAGALGVAGFLPTAKMQWILERSCS